MKSFKCNSNVRAFVLLIALLINVFLLASCSILPTQPLHLSAEKVFTGITIAGANAFFISDSIPTSTINNAPLVSTTSQIMKGQDISVDVSVPEGAEELLVSAASIKARYLDIQFGHDSDKVNGYYVISLKSAIPLSKTSHSPLAKTTAISMKTYSLKIGTSDDFYMNSFDIVIAFSTADGFSQAVHIPISIQAVRPTDNQLRVGFRPPSVQGFSLCIKRPDGSSLCYQDGSLTGCSECKLSYDEQSDIYWIDLPSDSGCYTITTQIPISCNGNQIVTLLLIINNAGKLEYHNGDLEISGSPSDPICTGKFTISFNYHMSICIYVTDFGINQYLGSDGSGNLITGDFANASGWVYPLEDKNRILLVMPQMSLSQIANNDLTQSLYDALKKRVFDEMQNGTNLFEIQLIEHIGFNVTGLLQFDPNYFDPGAQAAADIFGIYAYKALGMLRDDLIASGSTNLVFHAILGSNGTKVFAKNSSFWNSYIQDVYLFDGRAYKDDIKTNVIGVLGSSRVHIYNICGDWPAPNFFDAQAIGNWDVSNQLRTECQGLDIGLLKSINNSPNLLNWFPGHVSAMKYSKAVAFYLFRANSNCSSDIAIADAISTSQILPAIEK